MDLSSVQSCLEGENEAEEKIAGDQINEEDAQLPGQPEDYVDQDEVVAINTEDDAGLIEPRTHRIELNEPQVGEETEQVILVYLSIYLSQTVHSYLSQCTFECVRLYILYILYILYYISYYILYIIISYIYYIIYYIYVYICSSNAMNNLTLKKQKVCSLCYRHVETRRRKGCKRCDLFYGGE